MPFRRRVEQTRESQSSLKRVLVSEGFAGTELLHWSKSQSSLKRVLVSEIKLKFKFRAEHDAVAILFEASPGFGGWQR